MDIHFNSYHLLLMLMQHCAM